MVLLATVLLAGLVGVGSQKAVAEVAAFKWSLAAGVIVALVAFVGCRVWFVRRTVRDVLTTSPGLVDAVCTAVRAAGAQRRQTCGSELLPWIGLLMLRFLWVLHMIAAVVGGQVVYLHYNVDNPYAAMHTAALHGAWLFVLVCAVGACLPFDWATLAGVDSGDEGMVTWALVCLSCWLLITTAKWVCELEKDYKVVLFSPAVLDSCYLLVHAYAWGLEQAVLWFVFDCSLGPGLVCYGRLGKWPWQIALDAEETAQLAVNQAALKQAALNQEEWAVI
jgi:hypothetical protein